MNAKDKQVGGGHYKDMPIQPVEFITKNKLGFLEGCVIKRMCRWQSKDGLKDLRKAIHEIELLIEQTEEAEKLGHPMTGDRLTTSAEQAVRDFVKAHPEALRGESANFGPKGDPDPRGPEGVHGGRGIVGPNRPLDAVNRAPAFASKFPPIAVGEGQDWPTQAPNGTRVLIWRPRRPGDPGTHLFGWVEIGFMWDGELVRYDAEG